MENLSLWMQNVKAPHFPSLQKNIEVDVAIIGGGITGLSAALRLVNSGKKIVILEARKIGAGVTGYSTGNLYVPVQPYFQKIISKFNLETARSIADSRNFAINFIENIIIENNISCQFRRRPWYLFSNQSSQDNFLKKEIEAFHKIGLPISEIKELPIPLKIRKGLILHHQARFNPYKYVIELAKILQNQGCLICEDSKVIQLEENDHCLLQTEQAKIYAKKIIIATHSPIGIRSVQLFTAAYRSYVVAVKLKNEEYPEGHFWDLDRSHHALCTHPIATNHPEIFLVAGRHHKTGQDKNTLANFKNLETYLKKNFDIEQVVYQWSSQHFQTADDIPYIGLASRNAKHTYMATGYFADGLIYGTLAGLILADEILGKNNLWKNTYQSFRIKPIASFPFLLKENSNVMLQYMQDFPKCNTLKKMRAGEGKVIGKNQEKIAVYKDENNKLHAVSAVCTHMKCIVNWNNAEKTWDCPCHGSRFSIDGKVIDGPAIINLQKKDV